MPTWQQVSTLGSQRGGWTNAKLRITCRQELVLGCTHGCATGEHAADVGVLGPEPQPAVVCGQRSLGEGQRTSGEKSQQFWHPSESLP